MDKHLLLKALVMVVLFAQLGKLAYDKHNYADEEQAFRDSIEQHFTEGDEQIRMTKFYSRGNMLALELEINAEGGQQAYDKVSARSQAFVEEKVCFSPQLKAFLSQGNYISVDLKRPAEAGESAIQLNKVTLNRHSCS